MEAEHRSVAGAELIIRGPGGAGQSDLLIQSVATWGELASSMVQVIHSCPECGSSDHGKPTVRILANGQLVPAVSRSRCAQYEVVAIAAAGAVGVDIESISRVHAFPVDDVFLHEEEAGSMDGLAGAERSRTLALLWTAKEAVLKATGVGLRLDPRLLHIRQRADGALQLESMPDQLGSVGEVEIASFDITLDIVGAVALVR